MSAADNLSRKQFPKQGNEALDKAAAEGRSMTTNPAAQHEQEWARSYEANHPRPKGAVNVTAPGA